MSDKRTPKETEKLFFNMVNDMVKGNPAPKPKEKPKRKRVTKKK